jgi:ubiquinone/menaquinone biosynthesis C-methylase UbiE
MGLPAYALNQASFPELYERFLVGGLFRPWAEMLLDRVQLAPGSRVLDVGCGTGIVARLARARLGDHGTVVGVDVSPPMLEVARKIEPSVEWREGNAAALPVGPDERFDVVACQQALQFIPDKPAAVQEMKRVVRRGGRLAVATWGPLEQAPIFRDLQRVAERHVGPINDRRHSYGDAEALEVLLADAGFEAVHVETESRVIHLDSGVMFLRLNTNALIGMSAAASTLAEDERPRIAEAIIRDSTPVLSAYAAGEALAFEISANVATARG